MSDYPGEMSRLFDALHLDAAPDSSPPTQRQADAISASWIARYSALYPPAGT